MNKKTNIRFFYLAVVLAFLPSCQSTYKIATKPEGAEIYAGDKLLGKSPLTISASDIPTQMAGGVLIQVRNSGYKPISVWLPNSSYNTDYILNLTPFYERADSSIAIEDNAINRAELYVLSDLLLVMQNSLLHGTPIKEDEVKVLLETNPTLGSSYFLASLLALRQKKQSDALTLLKDAVRYSPAESDFLALLNEVAAENVKK